MATLVLTAVGTLVGGPIGGAIGAVIGQSADQLLFAPKARQGPRLGDLSVQTSSYGTSIPKVFGIMRVAGTVIWSTDLVERRTTSGGGKGRPKTTEYSYAASFAVALSARPIREVRRIWADGKLLRGAAGDLKAKAKLRVHAGGEDQPPDPLIVAAEGAGQAPAFRGTAYALFEELELADFGNRIPSLTFEVVADGEPVAMGALAAELSGQAIAGGAAASLSGYAASGTSVRAVLEELAAAFPLALVEEGGRLRLIEPAGPAVHIKAEQLTERLEVSRRGAASAPREVSITYYDAEREYQAGLQRAWAAGAPAEAPSERIGLPAVLSAAAAKSCAERRLDLLWAARETAVATLTWQGAGLSPGAVVAFDGDGRRWRVERRTLGAMTVRLELARMAGSQGDAVTATPGRPVTEPDVPHGPTVVRLIELPFADGGADRPVVAALAAGVRPGWRRALLSASFDGGASWRDLGLTAAPAVIGAAATALPAAGAALFDRRSSVEVTLLHEEMELLSRTDAALVAGANLALIGSELIQFGRAERLAPGRYLLSHLLRGRRGTEWAAGGHVAGEAFALVEREALRELDLPDGVGAGAAVRLLASGIADEQPAQADLVVAAEALRPPSPVHVRVSPTGSDLRIAWTRRSRIGWAWTDGADSPLGEEREHYRVTFAGSGGARDRDLEVPFIVYTAAERAADGPGPILVEIRQLGTHAPSRPATVILEQQEA